METATLEDEEKLQRRRERNKLAARKCRSKKKEAAQTIRKEYQTLECSNTELRYQVRMLEKEKDKLADLLQSHLSVCDKARERAAECSGQGQGRLHNKQLSTGAELNKDATDGNWNMGSGQCESSHNGPLSPDQCGACDLTSTSSDTLSLPNLGDCYDGQGRLSPYDQYQEML